MHSLNTSLSRYSAYAPVLLRFVIGALFVYHGIDKFDTGLSNVEGAFEGWGVPTPGITAPLSAVVEVAAGLLLIAGLATRAAALSLVGLIVGALIFVKLDASVLSGPEGAGSELDFIYLIGLLAIVLLGPGKLAADQALSLDSELEIPETPQKVNA